jgi:hypothetical protein
VFLPAVRCAGELNSGFGFDMNIHVEIMPLPLPFTNTPLPYNSPSHAPGVCDGFQASCGCDEARGRKEGRMAGELVRSQGS